MTLQGAIVIDLLGLALILTIVHLTRTEKLYAGYGVIWLAAIVGGMTLVSFPPLLAFVSSALGALVEVSALTLLAFAFVFAVLIYMSVQITIAGARITEIARTIALNELEGRKRNPAPRGVERP